VGASANWPFVPFWLTEGLFGHAGGMELPPKNLNWSAARTPARTAIDGELVRLEVLDPEGHAPSLFTASHVAGAEELWQHLPYGPFAGQADFTSWLEQRAASTDPLFYAVVDRESMRALGMASFLRMKPDNGVIEIGHIWFAPELQRTHKATEAIFLLAKTAFDDLGYRRLEWKCDSLNLPSRRAADRFGFTFEGIFRQHMIVKGRNRDTAWHSMTDGEWPSRRAAFEAWLAPENFDEKGRQRRSLAALRESIQVDRS
jgi:RimJ/RimL family protein N-acetyltransferase